jgi:hypothetical protein
MKKTILTLAMIVISIATYCQDMPIGKSGKITFKDMFNVSITTSESAEILNAYIDTCMFFQKDNNELTSAELQENILRYKGRIRTYYNEKRALLKENPTSTKGTFMKDKYIEWGYVTFDLSILNENGKVGYKFTNFEHKHDEEKGGGALERNIGQNTRQAFWDDYKHQVNKYVIQMIDEIKELYGDKGVSEEW